MTANREGSSVSDDNWSPPVTATPVAPVAADVADSAPARTWTPPPKRGLVPLRPIPFGQVLSAPFRLQRRTPRTTLAPALLVSLVTTAVALLAHWALTTAPQDALDSSYYDDFVIANNIVAASDAIAGWVPLALAFPATALLTGLVVVPAARALLAERVSFRGVRFRLRGRTASLFFWTLLVLLAAVGILALLSLLPLLAAASSPAGGALAFLAGFLELAALIPSLGYVIARLGFTSAVIAIEGLGIGPAMARSWRLTRGAGYRLLGGQLLIWIVVALASGVLSAPVGWVIDLAGGLIWPNGPSVAEAEWYGAGRTVVVNAVSAVLGAFGLVLQTVCAALLYLDQRMRVEALDLTLARYVDERQRGVAVADPFPAGGAG
jgi:hypothetical protein